MKKPSEIIVEKIQSDFCGWGDVYSTSELIQKVSNALESEGFSKKKVKLVFSVCPDDINRLRARETIENALVDEYGGEFHLGGLAGYPIGGVMGITAASNHVPDGGNLVFFISPHVGLNIGESCKYGKVMRPGKAQLTSSCSAMSGFLNDMKKTGDVKNCLSNNDEYYDPSATLLFTEFIEKENPSLEDLLEEKDENEQVIELAKKNYDFVMGKFKKLVGSFLKWGNFKGKHAIIGGLTVNTQKSDYFILKDLEL